jgi:hypothetical protein
MEAEYHHKSYPNHDDTKCGSLATFNIPYLFWFLSNEKTESKNNPTKHHIAQSENVANLIDIFHRMKKVFLD